MHREGTHQSPQLRQEAPLSHAGAPRTPGWAHLEVVLEGVRVGGAHAQGQLQQRLQACGRDVVHRLLQLLLRQVHEVHKEVSLVHQEVALDGPGRGDQQTSARPPAAHSSRTGERRWPVTEARKPRTRRRLSCHRQRDCDCGQLILSGTAQLSRTGPPGQGLQGAARKELLWGPGRGCRGVPVGAQAGPGLS